MTLRDLTEDEVRVLRDMCATAFVEHMKVRTLSSRGPREHFQAGYNACLKTRLALEPKAERNEPMGRE